jgi:hypothetical protein
MKPTFAAGTLPRVRRLPLVVLALAFAPAAHAATLEIVPRDFSPAQTRLSIDASLSLPRLVGVELTRLNGRHVGWISRPERRQRVLLQWDGRLENAHVHDGRYLVRLMFGRTELAATPVRIDSTAPTLRFLRVGNGNRPFAGDGALLTTVTPNGDGLRDSANIRFRLTEPAQVTLDVARTVTSPQTIYTLTQQFRAGPHRLVWTPPTNLRPRTYMLRLSVVDTAGNRQLYGSDNAFVGKHPRAPIVRVRGLDASFPRPSFLPGQSTTLRIAADAPELTLQVFQVGPDNIVTYADDQLAGVPVSEPQTVEWLLHRDAPASIPFTVGQWQSGLYYVELRAADGRVGYAPFVVRPTQLGADGRHVAVVLPTNTWQAYNFWDENGDGYGDTWYAGPPNYKVDLSRPYNNRGVPPRFYRYDLPFLHWLYWTSKSVDFLSDFDFDEIPTGDELTKHYDLIVFPGHEEYVTEHLFDVVARYRDLGGNLMFLSANNFFWRVRQTGNVLRKTGQFRQIGKPEARVIGVQYRANDDGRTQGNYVVRSATTAPWLWDGTGLTDGSTFGAYVGGYGIEIDAMTADSPPGTMVLADIPDLYGPGLTAQMTYYETPAGTKVFAAGTLDFGGSATFWPIRRMLENLWARLSQP